MRSMIATCLYLALTVGLQPAFGQARTVTPENFCRAESDRVFLDISKQAGGLNKFIHNRSLAPLDAQTAVRMNKDTLYSFAVVDTLYGASIGVPDVPKGRYFSVLEASA